MGPLELLDVPGHRLAHARFEALARAPAKLSRDLAGIHRIAPVVAWPVFDERDEIAIAAVRARTQFFEQRTDRADHFQIGLLRLAADVVGLARPPALQDHAD